MEEEASVETANPQLILGGAGTGTTAAQLHPAAAAAPGAGRPAARGGPHRGTTFEPSELQHGKSNIGKISVVHGFLKTDARRESMAVPLEMR